MAGNLNHDKDSTERVPAPKRGKAHSAETRLGTRHSAESRAKMSEARRGKPLSDEQRARIAEAMRRTETRAKIGAARLGKAHSAETRAKIGAANKGRVVSAEQRAMISATNTTHGHTRAGGKSPTYHSWQAMLRRCLNPTDPAYYHSGGSGVMVCDRWNPKAGGSFGNFLQDLGERPEGTALDRFPDPDGDYEPGNCRWATQAERNRNRGRFAPSRSGWISEPEYESKRGPGRPPKKVKP